MVEKTRYFAEQHYQYSITPPYQRPLLHYVEEVIPSSKSRVEEYSVYQLWWTAF